MKRLFIAIPISEALQKKALEFKQKYSSLTGQPPGPPPIRWLTGKNLHITIIPPWYDNDPARIIKILNKFANKTGPITIQFSNISYGPNPAAPRLIWASGQTPEPLTKFKKNLETLFLKEKILKQVESRPFLLHLTLARFRPEDFKNFPIKNLNQQIGWPETLDTFVLMESHLSSVGANYEILQQIKL